MKRVMCSSVNLIEIKTSIYCDEALSEQTVSYAFGTRSTQILIPDSHHFNIQRNVAFSVDPVHASMNCIKTKPKGLAGILAVPSCPPIFGLVSCWESVILMQMSSTDMIIKSTGKMQCVA